MNFIMQYFLTILTEKQTTKTNKQMHTCTHTLSFNCAYVQMEKTLRDLDTDEKEDFCLFIAKVEIMACYT